MARWGACHGATTRAGGEPTVALAKPVEAITADDATIAKALEGADLPAVLPTVAAITGDFSLLGEELGVDPALVMEDQGGLTEAQQAAIRQLALAALIRFR